MLHDCKDHLHSVNESYIEHMFFALRFGVRMIGGGLGAIAHAICPAICQTTGSRVLISLHTELQERMAAAHKK